MYEELVPVLVLRSNLFEMQVLLEKIRPDSAFFQRPSPVLLAGSW